MNTGVNSIDKHIAGRMRRRRRMLGLSQTNLADAINITHQMVMKYENCKNRVAASRLYEIANYLGVDIMYFYEGLDGISDPLSCEEKDLEALVKDFRAVPPKQQQAIRKAVHLIVGGNDVRTAAA